MPKTLRIVLAAVVMPALAIAAALSSLSSALTVTMPDRAAQLPLADGNAFAARTMGLLNGIDAGTPDFTAAARADGIRTFTSEPTSSAAVGLMALSRQLERDLPAARALYRDTILLSKRDRLANLWLIEDASANGRIGDALDRYDVLLRTGGEASDVLFDVLGTALREDVIVPHLEARLALRPPWAEQFWLRVATHGAAIGNIGRLRMRLQARGVDNPAGNDDDIIRRLVGEGELGLAASVFRQIAGKDGARYGSSISDFAEPARFPPFDWETFSGPGYGAEIDPKAGVMAAYTEEGVDTLVARHLLIVAGTGPFELAYQVRNEEALDALVTSIRAQCADHGSAPAQSVEMASARGRVNLAVPEDCRHLWVELWARKDSPRSEAADDVLIDRIAIRRAG